MTKVTDNSPYFIKVYLLKYKWLLLLSAFSVLGILFFWARQREAKDNAPRNYRQLLLLGIAYICLVMGVIGPATLLIGSPQLATPLIYLSLFLFAMLGGLATLGTERKDRRIAYALLIGYLIALPIVYVMVKGWILPQESTVLRCMVAFVFVGVAAFLAEIPYIQALNLYDGNRRGWSFAFGKIGVLVGLLFGLYMQLGFGFIGPFVTSIAFYSMAWFIKKSKFA